MRSTLCRPRMLTLLATMVALTLTHPVRAEFPPANPNASCQARAVLHYLYEISGKGILGGVHGENFNVDRMFELIKAETGVYPSFYSGDFRYGTDLASRRRAVVNEMKTKWNNDKVIVSLMWHMTRPMDPETMGFEESVQSSITEADMNNLLTPGSDLNRKWIARLDSIAVYLKELRDAGVPILWRPYHEMNGGWFWWGAQPRFKELWIQMYDRYVNFHNLNNLLWVWSPNCVVFGAGALADFYPGHAYVDVLAEDIYANKSYDWEQYFYDDLLSLAQGRPISMGEVGDLPDPAFLKANQPNWVSFMLWPGYEHQYANNATRNKYVYTHEFTISKDEISSTPFTCGSTAVPGEFTAPLQRSPHQRPLSVLGQAPGTGGPWMMTIVRNQSAGFEVSGRQVPGIPQPLDEIVRGAR